jgi:hypothetical protein
MLAICILSVFYFALAAPVAVRDKPEVRSNAVDAGEESDARTRQPEFSDYFGISTEMILVRSR